MLSPVTRTESLVSLALTITLACGCGQKESQPATGSAGETDTQKTTTNAGQSTGVPNGENPQRRTFTAFSFGEDSSGGGTAGEPSGEQQTQDVIDALKPLQIMLGTWRGTTRKENSEGFKYVDSHSWVFDFRTDRTQPALVMQSDKSPYFRDMRLTFLADKNIYQLTGADGEGTRRTMQGNFTQQVVDEPGGADGKLQRTYKLELTEVGGQNEEPWQITFNQQENNRYLLQVSRKRGNQKSFRLFDTVSTQREGTSFALSDTDYGEKECIVSQGLGTIAVNHAGKTYWVCCTGCKAAFEDDPEHWVAKLEKRMAENSKQ